MPTASPSAPLIIEIVGPISDPTYVITDTTIPLSDLIEAWEQADQEAGVIDQRHEPYSIIAVSVDQTGSRLFLPLVAGGEESVSAAKPASEQQWIGFGGEPLTAEQIAFSLEVSRQYELVAARDLAALQTRVDAALTSASGTEQNDAVLGTVYINKSLSGLNTIKEQQDDDHRNHCGPATISVALDALWPLSSIPSQDTIATTIRSYPGGWWVNGAFYRHFDKTVGTSGEGLCRYLHDYFKNNFAYRYLLSPTSISLSDSQDFWRKTSAHVDRNYALVTGTLTYYLKDWNRSAPHINAVIGYEAYLTNGWYYDMRNVRYAETATAFHGYIGGQFKIMHESEKLLTAARKNNVQCLLDPIVY